jgi:hypothetical protein
LIAGSEASRRMHYKSGDFTFFITEFIADQKEIILLQTFALSGTREGCFSCENREFTQV